MNSTFQYGTALLPILITAATAVVVMLGIAWRRNHGATFLLTVIGLVAALVSIPCSLSVGALGITPLLQSGSFSALFAALVLIASLACAVFAYAYLRGDEKHEGYPGNREEFYLLLLLSATGGLVMAYARHFAALFIGLELLSIPLYGMIGYAFFTRRSLEAAMKYLVLSTAGSAFILFGMALWYAEVGDLSFAALGHAGFAGPLSQLGLALILVGFGFKISLVPFHVWTPDVYQGAPAPAANYLSTASKVAAFAVLLRLFESVPLADAHWVQGLLVVIGVLSMLAGNLLALRQINVKRMLGYSSVAHLGYLLIVLAAEGGIRTETAAVYLATYMITMLGAFGVVGLLSSPYRGEERASLDDWRGLSRRHPGLVIAFAIMMLSLAGIPLSAGFIGKFYLMALAVNTHLWWMLGALIIGSGISLFYYLRAAVAPFRKAEDAGATLTVGGPHWSWKLGGWMVALMTALVLLLGFYPQPLISLAIAAGSAG